MISSDTATRWRDTILHTTGSVPTNRKSKHGFRNYYCAPTTGETFDDMQAMVAAGFMRAGRTINGGTCQYFFATREGCEFAGMSKAATNRSLVTTDVERSA